MFLSHVYPKCITSVAARRVYFLGLTGGANSIDFTNKVIIVILKVYGCKQVGAIYCHCMGSAGAKTCNL